MRERGGCVCRTLYPQTQLDPQAGSSGVALLYMVSTAPSELGRSSLCCEYSGPSVIWLTIACLLISGCGQLSG